ncbi:SDR family oxidoreductase [Croceibacterium sp. TMG7-5b_MA50]|uniref:SDR family oxidoreductase n=1 Tax=Croceibacterium sp. TMG7-5b_MA50 TaxID=3121290 RepID=UPI0032215A61
MRVIITGAAGALGTACVQAFADAGHAVAGIVRRHNPDLPAGVRQVLCADLADPDAAAAALREAAGDGPVDALLHVAGGFAFAKVADSEWSQWERLGRDNLGSAVACTRAVLPLLADGAAILCVGAAGAQVAGAGMAPYAAAKSGVARLVEALSAELKPRRIRVNAVLPATIDTPANRAAMPDADPAGWTSPAAIADALLFLAGPGARAINGALVPVTNNA